MTEEELDALTSVIILARNHVKDGKFPRVLYDMYMDQIRLLERIIFRECGS